MVVVSLVPNETLESPNYEITRVRTDHMGQDNNGGLSYKIKQDFAAESRAALTPAQIASRAPMEPAVKTLLAAAPAPLPLDAVVAPPPAAIAAPAAAPVLKPVAAGGLLAWLKSLFGGSKPAEAPAPALPAPVPAAQSRPQQRDPRRDGGRPQQGGQQRRDGGRDAQRDGQNRGGRPQDGQRRDGRNDGQRGDHRGPRPENRPEGRNDGRSESRGGDNRNAERGNNNGGRNPQQQPRPQQQPQPPRQAAAVEPLEPVVGANPEVAAAQGPRPQQGAGAEAGSEGSARRGRRGRRGRGRGGRGSEAAGASASAEPRSGEFEVTGNGVEAAQVATAALASSQVDAVPIVPPVYTPSPEADAPDYAPRRDQRPRPVEAVAEANFVADEIAETTENPAAFEPIAAVHTLEAAESVALQQEAPVNIEATAVASTAAAESIVEPTPPPPVAEPAAIIVPELETAAAIAEPVAAAASVTAVIAEADDATLQGTSEAISPATVAITPEAESAVVEHAAPLEEVAIGHVPALLPSPQPIEAAREPTQHEPIAAAAANDGHSASDHAAEQAPQKSNEGHHPG
jgi:ribonuclease E